ncbi:Accessory protein for dissimilatory nitrite reduction [Hyphomicrobium sp. 1Nfss2.1]|uniref:SUMF1/EgtB/PvdO family nonheme iron enzyme n=1 Tax=Hyphomicrobium sp. 1Nfss2.1 TaxID=3413936 RepID=UPI003C7D39DB
MASLLSRPDATLALIAAPSLLVVLIAGGLALRSGVINHASEGVAVSTPETVTVASRTYNYRAPGEYTRDGYAVDAPLLAISGTPSLTIMKYQVSRGEYDRCVADGACPQPEPEHLPSGKVDVPVTGVSLEDAQAYANWLSRQTGEAWRLPTDSELAFAAGSRFPDDALGTDSPNPAVRWLERYRRETARGAARDPVPKQRGHFGENEFGLADFGGNVWEWTTTCYRRVIAGATEQADTSPCGVQFVSGEHRAAMVSFIRNPKGGGCAVGAPPENLGFRLVKDGRWYEPLLKAFR